ncbi:MAG: AtpZ/AtpI family protein [Saprospiraceae bacterium]|nr:AtpZ/AtpI family protein [Saprospiraceae bacterium]
MPLEPGDVKKKSASYMKYAGLAFQMAIIFFIGIYGGKKLDAYFGHETPGITIFLIFFLFIGYMYKLFHELK